MNLFCSIGIFAIIFCHFAECAVGNLINLSLAVVNLLDSFEAQFEENFICGEVKRIPYAQFTKDSFNPSVSSADDLFKHLVANKKSIKLSIYYGNSWLDVFNIEPTIVTDNEENFFGFGFQLRPYDYKQVILTGVVEYIGHFEESTSQLIFFENVIGVRTFAALTHDLQKNKIFLMKVTGSAKTFRIRQSDLTIKPLNSTHGSGLFLTFTRIVSVCNSTQSIITVAYFNTKDSILEFETSQSSNLLENIESSPWLEYNFYLNFEKFRVIPTTSTSTEPNEPDGFFTVFQKFIPSMVFWTAVPKSKTFALIYKDTKRIEIYSNVDVGTLQDFIRNSLFGYYQDVSGDVKTVVPEEKFDIDPAKYSGYNYLKFSFEHTVKVAILKETLVGKITGKTLQLFGSQETLQKVTTAGKSQLWAITYPNETKAVVKVNINSEPLPIKDMFYIDVSF